MDICANFVLESKHLEFKGKKDSEGKRSLLCQTERFAQGSGVLFARGLISVAAMCCSVMKSAFEPV